MAPNILFIKCLLQTIFLERSRNGLDFDVLSTLTGAGTTSEVSTYSFVDQNPLTGTSYYKLKQTDFDGQFEYFDAKSVYIGDPIGSELKTYPNPATNLIQLQDFSGDVKSIRVLNIHGKDITTLVSFSGGINGVSVNLERLESGIYFLKASGASTKIVKN